jgi:N-acetylmuramoyl-L-alanine amidase
MLTSQGATVVMTREKDEWLSVYNRIAQVGRLTLDRFTRELPGKGYDSTAISHLMPQLQDMITINSDTADSGGRGLMKGVGASADARLLLDIQDQFQDVLFISLHCNAMGDGNQTGGLQIFYQTNESNYKKETSYVRYQASTINPPAYMSYNDEGRLKLANNLYRCIIEQEPKLESKGNSGVLIGDYAVLREINLVSVLVEMGFVTSPTDRAILKNAEDQRKIAQGVTNAVMAYFNGSSSK